MRTQSGILQILWLASMVGSAVPLAGQSADSSGSGVRSIVSELPATSRIRVATAGKRWSGELVQLGQDSMILRTEKTGALMFALLQLEGSSEDPGLNTRMGLVLLGGATVVGLLVDGASASWARRFPASGE